MKVTILVPGRWHAFDLARELNQRGALELLVTSYPKVKTRQWGIPDERVRSIFWHYLLTRGVWEAGGEGLDIRMGHYLFSLFGRASLRHVLDCGLVHAWAGAGLESLLAPGRARRTIVMDRASAHRVEQDQILSEESRRWGKSRPVRPGKMVERELAEYEQCDGVIVPSLFVEESFRRQNFPKHKLHRSCLGVNAQTFPRKASDEPSEIFRALYVGSLSLRKGTHHLLEAFRSAQLPNSELRLIGGQRRDWVEFGHPSSPGVHWLGHLPQPHLAGHYQKASVFVMPSLEEGQAMVQLQALACGLPLICTTHTGGEDLLQLGGPAKNPAEGIREYPAGFVVPAGQAAPLAWCLRKLHSDPGLLAEKRAATARIPVEQFSWSAYAERNLAIYEKILRKKQVASAAIP